MFAFLDPSRTFAYMTAVAMGDYDAAARILWTDDLVTLNFTPRTSSDRSTLAKRPALCSRHT